MNQVNSMGTEGRQDLFNDTQGGGEEATYTDVQMWAQKRSMPEAQKAALADYLPDAEAAVDGGEDDVEGTFNSTEMKIALDMSKGMDMNTAAKNHIDWARSQKGQIIHMGGQELTSQGNGTFQNAEGESFRVTGAGGVGGDGGVAAVQPNEIISRTNSHTYQEAPPAGERVTFADSFGNVHEGVSKGNGIIHTDDGKAWLNTTEQGIKEVESGKLLNRTNGETVSSGTTDSGNPGDSYVSSDGDLFTRQGTGNVFDREAGDGSYSVKVLYPTEEGEGYPVTVNSGFSYDARNGNEVTTPQEGAAVGSHLVTVL